MNKLLIVGLIVSWVYLFLYGAICYKLAGFVGLLMGLNFILLGSIIGLILIKSKGEK